MRILLISHVPSNPNGGSSLVYHLLHDGLTARGHEIKTLHYGDFAIPSKLQKVVSRLFLPQVASRRASQEKISDYDVIMSSSGTLYPLFKQLQVLPKRPLLVSHLHGSSFYDHQARITENMRAHLPLSRLYRHITGTIPLRWDEYGAKYGDLTIVQNSRDLDFFLEKGVDPAVIIPLPVHPQIMEAGKSAPPPENRDPYSLLWFGTWIERKGCHYLPNAFKMIAKKYPQAKLSIGGAGLGEEALRRHFDPSLWSRLNVIPHVSREQQIAEYARHSIFLFPSLSEGFGFALLEAMSMGLAAVTTQSGLGADWLTDHENAIIIPSSSAYHIAAGAIKLIEDSGLRCRVARNGQNLAQTFTTARFLDSYESIFEEYRNKSRQG